MATFPIKVELGFNGTTWTDVSSDVRYQDRIRITRGRRDEGSQTDTARCLFTLDNSDGRYTPKNPTGPYFGQIGRNTPCRVSVMAGEAYLDLPSISTLDYAETPDTAALDITGDIDVRADLTLANWLPPATDSPATTEMMGKFGQAGQRSWFLGGRGGRLYFEWSADGTNTIGASSTIPPVIPGSGRLAIRAWLDVDNGSGGWTVRFYTAAHLDAPWTQLGDPVTGSGVTSIFNSTAGVRIGNATPIGFSMPLGRAHAAEIRSGAWGTVVAQPRFNQQAIGATSFVDSAGRTWTLNGNTSITNRQTRFVGEVTSWPVRWQTKQDVVVNVEASGISRRMSQGVSPVRSPMYREFTNPARTAIVAYWPMEDDEAATRFASALDGQPPLTLSTAGGVQPAAFSGWAASAPLPTVTWGAMRARVPAYTASGAVSVRVFVQVPAGGVSGTDELFGFTATGSARTWRVFINTSGNLELRVHDADGVQILGTGFFVFGINGVPRMLQLELVQNGANIDWNLASFTMADTSVSATSSSGTILGQTFGAATEMEIGQDGLLNGTALGHLVVASATTAYAGTAGAMVGWNGETTTARVWRLGAEEKAYCYPASVSEERMGVQGQATLLDVMRECEAVDQGVLFESRDAYPVFRFRDHVSLYNQAPAMVLNYRGGDGLVTPLEPTDDDQSVRNDRTVQRTGGSSTRRTLDAGPLSIQAPPNGVGTYDDSTSLNLFSDAQTSDQAGWLLHLGTVDETRYPVVRMMLAAAPSKVAQAAAVDIGDRIQITNPPSWLPPDTIDLMVQGYSEDLDQFEWTISFNCTPATPWDVAWSGNASAATAAREFQWQDTAGSQLAEALTTTETDVDVTTTSGPLWTPNVADTPFDWRVAGEVMTVTAPGSLTTDNPFFDTDLSGWSTSNVVIDRSTTYVCPHPRARSSMRIVPDGVSASGSPNSAITAAGTVTPGATYTASMWVFSVNGWSDVRPTIDWHNAAGTFISTSVGSAYTVPASTWTYLESTYAAPAGVSRMRVRARIGATPAASDVLYAWAVRGTRARSSWLYDTFGRTASSTWDLAESGQTWQTGGGTAADYNVTGGYGAHRLSVANSSRRTFVDCPYPDFDYYASLTTSATATGGSIFGGPTGRYIDSSNLYHCRVAFSTTNTLTLAIIRMVGGVETSLGSATIERAYAPGTWVRVRFQASGTTLRAKAYLAGAPEPNVWHVTATDSAISTSSYIGVRSISASTNTNTNPEVRYDDLDVVNPQTYTVTRSANGAIKNQNAGAAVALATPTVQAL
ncbi:hypothetical protein [Streptomyces flaveolus]|uniref:hypothetical protein n=1 Tax=Streptomyces flaveolus TaxID=67297 RepID=UPI001670AFCC|nr:hypothetical protein [Streptomyces flaveolus]GGQ83857.1 hypothetical protein GCM10010216_52190 [Streptomyces flaveolus]